MVEHEEAELEAQPESENTGAANSPVIATFGDQEIRELPKDLYIPPEALEVFLETFEGPLDLLLYLIRKQNLDILNIPIAEITRQYMTYVEMMKAVKLELAADYLVMAATLAEIKSRMLLPRVETEDEEEIDPRAELVRRLQAYEQIKQAAEDLDQLPRLGRDYFPTKLQICLDEVKPKVPEFDLSELLHAFREVVIRADLTVSHNVERESLSVREKMAHVLDRLQNFNGFLEFVDLFNLEEGRPGIVVTFLAILELVKGSLIELIQAEPFGPIHLRVAESEVA